MTRKYLTPAEVSSRYSDRVTTRTLANWRWAGSGPKFTRIGGRILYDLQELIKWEDRRTVEHTSEYKK